MNDLPQDMRDLLVRLDTKVDGITDTLRDMSKRQDNHETRIATLEKTSEVRGALITEHKAAIADIAELKNWRTEIRGAVKFGGAFKTLALASTAFLAVIGYKIAVEPVAPPTVQIENNQKK